MTKEERLRSGESLMSHAMAFTGYDKRDDEDFPNKWRVENRCRVVASEASAAGLCRKGRFAFPVFPADFSGILFAKSQPLEKKKRVELNGKKKKNQAEFCAPRASAHSTGSSFPCERGEVAFMIFYLWLNSADFFVFRVQLSP